MHTATGEWDRDGKEHWQVWDYGDGKVGVSEYDESGNFVKETKYDADGNEIE